MPKRAFERNSKSGAGCLLDQHGRTLFEPAQFQLERWIDLATELSTLRLNKEAD